MTIKITRSSSSNWHRWLQPVSRYVTSARLDYVRRQLQEAHVLFAVLALLGGLALVHIVPPLWGTDEATHVARVYQLASGQVIASKTPDKAYGGTVPDNLMQLILYVSKDATNNPNIFEPAAALYGRHDVDSRAAYAPYVAKRLSTTTVPFSFPATASYSPVAYAGSLPGFALGKLLHLSLGKDLVLSRLTTLLAYCVLVFIGLLLLRESRLKWFVFLVALLPTSLVQASIVSGDAVIMGLAILLFGAVIASRQPSRRLSNFWLLVLIGIAAIALPLTKPTYFPLAALVVFVPGALFASRRRAIIYKSSVVAASLALLLAWTYLTRHISQSVPLIEGPKLAPLVDAHRQLHFMLHQPVSAVGAYLNSILSYNAFFTVGLIGAMSWNAFIPIWLAGLSLMMLTVGLLYSDVQKQSRFNWAAGAIALLTVFVIFSVFYITYTPVGMHTILGMQGRYFIPVLPLLAVGIRRLVPIDRLTTKLNPALLFGAPAAFVLVSSLVFYWMILY